MAIELLVRFVGLSASLTLLVKERRDCELDWGEGSGFAWHVDDDSIAIQLASDLNFELKPTPLGL